MSEKPPSIHEIHTEQEEMETFLASAKEQLAKRRIGYQAMIEEIAQETASSEHAHEYAREKDQEIREFERDYPSLAKRYWNALARYRTAQEDIDTQTERMRSNAMIVETAIAEMAEILDELENDLKKKRS